LRRVLQGIASKITIALQKKNFIHNGARRGAKGRNVLVQALWVLMTVSFLTAASLAQGRPNRTLAELKAQKFIVQTTDGKRVPLASLLGRGAPVVLDFWATWCGPCRAEIPHLKELAQKYQRNGLIVVGLNLEDPVKDKAVVAKFMKEFAMNYTVAFAPSQAYFYFNPGVERYRIPQTYVFDGQGTLVRGLVGYNANAGQAILTAAVEKAVLGSQAKK
jgi:thiol-disulfide isomerase/thioredoxin